MDKITMFEKLLEAQGKEFILKPFFVTPDMIKYFSMSTGCIDEHNFSPTDLFPEGAVVQGYLSLALFGKFQDEILHLKNVNRTNWSIGQVRFVRPVYVGKSFIPVIKICLVDKNTERIQITWRYELQDEKSKKKLLSAILVWKYFFTEKT